MKSVLVAFGFLIVLSWSSSAQEIDYQLAYTYTCEEQSENMAQVYGCLDQRREEGLEQQYQKTWLALAAFQSREVLEALEGSQGAWLKAMYEYCNVVALMARDQMGAYARDANINCLNMHFAERSQALADMLTAAKYQDFTPWTR